MPVLFSGSILHCEPAELSLIRGDSKSVKWKILEGTGVGRDDAQAGAAGGSRGIRRVGRGHPSDQKQKDGRLGREPEAGKFFV